MAPRKFHKSKKIVCEVEGREAVEAICVFHRLWSNKWLINVETPNESAPLSVSIIVPAVETYLAMEIDRERGNWIDSRITVHGACLSAI